MNARRILFRFDYLSPYAYLAWTQIHVLAERHGAVVEPVPVLFAGLLNHFGQKGPAEIPAKRVYTYKDCLRKAALYGVPFRSPPTHPFNPLLALRATIAAEQHRGLIDGLFAAVWGDVPEKGVDRVEVVTSVAERAGLDGAALIERTRDPVIKGMLRTHTDEAIAAGVFGVPTMSVNGEGFWGTESMVLLEQHLRGEDPVSAGYAAFEDLPEGATR